MVKVRYPVLIIFILTLLGAGYLGFASIELVHDKILHFFTFCIVTLEFYFIFDAPFKSLKIIRYLTFVICTLAGSLGSEILQHIVNPARVFDPYDILCNVLGSLLGLGISITYSHYKKGKAKKERFRYNRLMNSDLRAVEEIVLEEGDCSVANGENSGRSTPNDYVNIQMKDF